jgi:glycosyltransferase A (GT-A) superfamily protein (DUF2064 family)
MTMQRIESAAMKSWAVDEILECLTFGADRPVVTAELLRVAPTAYHRAVRLGRVWSRIEPNTQRLIETAYAKEMSR